MAIVGIDLGTTNSLIGLTAKDYLSDIVPSCVDMETGRAGKAYYNDMKAARSFKVDMSMGSEGIKPRVASKFVLQELVRVAEHDLQMKITDAIISVPAYFTDSQRAATAEAAKQAGINLRGLVNEPTAAAMYIAKNKKGLFVVYDLGGGTFDCSIIDSRFGAYDVQATSGRIIGGDNLDKMIMKHIIKMARIPVHKLSPELRIKLQHFCSYAKVLMQKERKDMEVDLSPFNGSKMIFKESAYIDLMKMTFDETINCMKQLISDYIPDNEVFDILLVGGSTHCPYLREWIKEATGTEPAPVTYDPDRVVALGAALYAELVDNGTVDVVVSDVTKALSIGLYDGTVSVIVPSNSKIPLSIEHMFVNPMDASKLQLDLYQGESTFAKDNECIGSLMWEYERMVPAQEGQVLVTISIDNAGLITFSAGELLREPKTVVLRRQDTRKDDNR